MTDTAMIALVIIASAWTIFLFWRGTFEKTVTAALLLLIFGAGLAQTLLPVRFILALAALSFIVTTIVRYRNALGQEVIRTACMTSTIGFVAYGVLQIFIDAEMLDPLFRYSVLFPLMFVAGYVASHAHSGVVLSGAYLLTSLAMAVLAIYERLENSFLVAGTYENAARFVRDGSIRSIVGAEHPLVLSVLLVAAIPLVQSVLSSLALRIGVCAVLIAGIASTNSRGALALIVIWFVIAAALKGRVLSRIPTSVLRFVAGTSVVIGLAWTLTGTGSESLTSTSAVAASAEYRSSLYLFAAQSLMEQPFGWGLSGLPAGVYIVASYFGSLDISVTIDSEVALLMFDFGWMGILGFVALAFYLLQAERLSSPRGQAALLLSASGFYLALHSWSGLGSAWFLLLGLAASYRPNQPKCVRAVASNHNQGGPNSRTLIG